MVVITPSIRGENFESNKKYISKYFEEKGLYTLQKKDNGDIKKMLERTRNFCDNVQKKGLVKGDNVNNPPVDRSKIGASSHKKNLFCRFIAWIIAQVKKVINFFYHLPSRFKKKKLTPNENTSSNDLSNKSNISNKNVTNV